MDEQHELGKLLNDAFEFAATYPATMRQRKEPAHVIKRLNLLLKLKMGMAKSYHQKPRAN